ncbi:MAG: septum formation initiator family protein [Candidatus Latescibacteria bacterium]|nr:septum formation initiator family protein [Candidatus Latescibacterota bacterium]
MARSPLRSQAEPAGKSRWRLGLALLVLGFILYLFVGGDEGLLEIRRQSQALALLQARLDQLQAENDSLRQILWMLEHDKDYIEKVAREEYGMIKPGEKVYRLRGPGEQPVGE